MRSGSLHLPFMSDGAEIVLPAPTHYYTLARCFAQLMGWFTMSEERRLTQKPAALNLLDPIELDG